MTKTVQDLIDILNGLPHLTPRDAAIIAFQFFRDLATEQVIDFDTLDAMLKDTGAN